MRTLLIACLGLCSLNSYANDLTPEQKVVVQQFIQHFKNNDVNAIVQLVDYPLKREAPLPAIKNAQEMKQRYTQVFDAKLSHSIATSKISDWDQYGWRGISLSNETTQNDVWLRDNDNESTGTNLKIIAVNHSSAAEEKWRQQLLQQQQNTLHSSLQQFQEPIYLFKTKNHLVRVDQLNTDTYRYASWKNNQNQAAKPDLILKSTDFEVEGTARNEIVRFKSGPYTYEVYRNRMGESSADMFLTVFKHDEEVLNEEGMLLPY